MSDAPAVPPWKPIAEFLARKNGNGGFPTDEEAHERYEKDAKMLGYEIAAHADTDLEGYDE